MLRSLLQFASPAGKRARLSVLVLHRVLPATDPMYREAMDAARFDKMCHWLRSLFSVLPLDEGALRLRDGSLPERALAITFDDGYADNFTQALPILTRHGLCATFFIATGFIDGGRMWNDTIIESFRRTELPVLDLRDVLGPEVMPFPMSDGRVRRIAIEKVIDCIKYQRVDERDGMVRLIAERTGATLPDDLMMTAVQVRELRRAGMQIGAHTVSHPILARLDAKAARREIADSKTFLEGLLGERIALFAYPNGKPGRDFTPESVEIARGIGFDAAVSTERGAADRNTDPFQIPRFTPWDRTRLRFGARMVSTLWGGSAPRGTRNGQAKQSFDTHS